MESTAVEAVALSGSVGATDLSVWALFLQADVVVKIVMIILAMASFWSWAIIFEKSLRLRRINRETDEFEAAFWSGGSLEALYERVEKQPGHPMAAIFAAAMREWQRATSRGLAAGSGLKTSLQQRIDRAMDITLGREVDRLERYLPFLASVGSTAPFVGLFGTVWGIMNSFTSIGLTKNTSLAVVAPGIAEALFATAIGLVTAIPAVLAYNKLSIDLGRYGGRLESFAAEFSAILSRRLEEKA